MATKTIGPHVSPEYDETLSLAARLEARAARLGTSGGAALDAELLLDARSAITDLLAACVLLLHATETTTEDRPSLRNYWAKAMRDGQTAIAKAGGKAGG